MKTLRHLFTNFGLFVISSTLALHAQSDGYSAHEWGTFTSVQGGNGVPLMWKLVRVMVGRAEVIQPSVVEELREDFAQGSRGNQEAFRHAVLLLKKLGRFAGPARQLATANPFN